MTAAAITHRLQLAGLDRTGPGAIFTVLSDDHQVHCMTAEMLDAWWASLPPEQKAEIFDRELDADAGESHALALDHVPTLQFGLAAACDAMERTMRQPMELHAAPHVRAGAHRSEGALALGTSHRLAVEVDEAAGVHHRGAQGARSLRHDSGEVVAGAARHHASLAPTSVDAVEGGR